MKLIKIKKNDGELVKKFGKVEAVIDPDSKDETHYLRGMSSLHPIDGESFKMASNAKEAAENIDKMISIYKKHIADLEKAKKWFLSNK